MLSRNLHEGSRLFLTLPCISQVQPLLALVVYKCIGAFRFKSSSAIGVWVGRGQYATDVVAASRKPCDAWQYLTKGDMARLQQPQGN